MFRKKVMVLMAAAVFGMAIHGGSGRAFAHEGHEHDGAVSPAGSAVEAEKRELCPVSGEEIEQLGKYTYEYKGKVYNLCSADCLEDFKKSPEKYIGKMKGASAKNAPEPDPAGHEGHGHDHH